ncbi:MAG: hypothetical protein UR69_C0002G0252 [Candidatus Moranbacteria bacterium GW2011_GWE2_35_2-]|nr:MAG: hypothetical protein UR69_C0002G0252 [Candidatus Moranbacteria bacterium GW2011_GWE2_35_2-]KKQ30662.1 MAG: hypothetical protein US47_C0002G0252 [Candidatus Moranbacteria bacterium GW2011_GWE1_37_24]KKQ47764.1 MAG: hypothetical protein US66_C0006G0023 [Candidatus Moranbacteria bacterium GW2011_GWD2_37_9]
MKNYSINTKSFCTFSAFIYFLFLIVILRFDFLHFIILSNPFLSVRYAIHRSKVDHETYPTHSYPLDGEQL